MICEKCGSNVNDNALYCPVCNAKIKKAAENKNAENYRPKSKVPKILSVIAVILIAFAVIYPTSLGQFIIAPLVEPVVMPFYPGIRYNIAFRYESEHRYEEAYKILDALNDKKAEQYINYYKFMAECKRLAAASLFDCDGNTWRSVSQEEVTSLIYDNEELSFKIDDLNNILTLGKQLSENSDYLNDEQRKNISVAAEMELCCEDAEQFRLCLTEACNIYYDIEKATNNFVSVSQFAQTVQGRKESYDEALNIFYKYADENETFYNASYIDLCIDGILNLLSETLAEGKTKISLSESANEYPYLDGEIDKIIVNNLKLKAVQKCINENITFS